MAEEKDAKQKALSLAVEQIEKNHGKGSIMRLGDGVIEPVATISTMPPMLSPDFLAEISARSISPAVSGSVQRNGFFSAFSLMSSNPACGALTPPSSTT